MADDEMYLENLKEFVLDEERIVTYKWLSRTLSVNVNQAKQMLYAFKKQQDEEKTENLSTVYAIGGLIKDKNGNLIQKYLFSREKDLQDIKQCYEIITSLHLYSIQKGKPKKIAQQYMTTIMSEDDSSALYLADYDLQKQNLDSPHRFSNIALKTITKRSSEFQQTLTTTKTKSDETEKEKSNGFQKPAQNRKQVQATSAFSASTSKSTRGSKAKPVMKKSDVTSFFARQAASKDKETIKSVDKSSNDKEIQQKKNESSEHEREQNKSDTTVVDKNVKTDEKKIEDKKEASLEEKKEKQKGDETGEKNDEAKEKNDGTQDSKQKTKLVEHSNGDAEKLSPKQGSKRPPKAPKENKIEKESQNGKVAKSKRRKTSSRERESEEKTNKPKKKRKRVKNFSDTSSEEDNTLETKQSSSDSTPIPDQQDVKPELQKARRRKRVLKSKTYLNDEGYMVTEKVYESESASDEDEQKQPETACKADTHKPTDSVQPPKKKPASKATKQASLTSFFKRT